MSRYLEDDDFIEQEKISYCKRKSCSSTNTNCNCSENLDEEQKRVRLAADYARDVLRLSLQSLHLLILQHFVLLKKNLWVLIFLLALHLNILLNL
jgi:hypothetical protein